MQNHELHFAATDQGRRTVISGGPAILGDVVVAASLTVTSRCGSVTSKSQPDNCPVCYRSSHSTDCRSAATKTVMSANTNRRSPLMDRSEMIVQVSK